MKCPVTRRSRSIVALSLFTCFTGLVSIASENERQSIRADIWADNWFALYNGNNLVIEDSVAYNTERSFNSDSVLFDATLPAHVNVIMKDFKENDTGLEYIGTPRQQIGDGGFIAQFFDADTGELLAASDESWRCKTIHRAPLNKSCVNSTEPGSSCQSVVEIEPEGWMQAAYDDSDWQQATLHSAQAVRPRRGYDEVSWNPAAKLIWGEDLEIDNTILCRFVIPAD